MKFLVIKILDKSTKIKFSFKFLSCDKLIFVLHDHYVQSKIVRWFIGKNYVKTDMKFKDYLIWSSNKEL